MTSQTQTFFLMAHTHLTFNTVFPKRLVTEYIETSLEARQSLAHCAHTHHPSHYANIRKIAKLLTPSVDLTKLVHLSTASVDLTKVGFI